MKKIKTLRKLLLTAAVSGVLFSPNTFATTANNVSGGIITFSGSVTDTTCNITTNDGNDFTVNLNPISTEDLGTDIGVVTAQAAQFTLHVAGCTGYRNDSTSAQQLDITFSGANISDDEKYLKNDLGSARGVGITITRDGGNTLVPLNRAVQTGLATTKSGETNYDTAPEGDITWFANYYNYGGASVTTGSVITTATYSFSYE
ncbi:fimbrial protein [Mixta tenebrionis]|uniref:Type 1 fimbrial protein n=1 Tax=Mixta tenebrionis TaxID=2562439 RepID=A0A506V8I5_9GAMM|nr:MULTISPECIES: fimbrial protein [Mixta]QHM74235.1 hypothetical protein C7M52_00158 [Mixta theicola]TPW41752.1 type 1 fimbrial protein [Mixta tenebrionis]